MFKFFPNPGTRDSLFPYREKANPWERQHALAWLRAAFALLAWGSLSAADPSAPAQAGRLYELWNPASAYPAIEEIPFLPVVTHVSVERATPAGYHYLHESGIAVHKGVLHAIWANGPAELNFTKELVRGKISRDGGITWSAPRVIAPGMEEGAHNHPSVFSHAGQLWFFVTRFDRSARRIPQMEVLVWNEKADTYESRGVVAREFVVFDTPKRMPDGNWILAGEKSFNTHPRVLISRGDTFLQWDAVDIPIPAGARMTYPETTVIVGADEIVAITRNRVVNRALVSTSKDNGRTWSVGQPSNLPMGYSKPLGGTLSTGQRFLIYNGGDVDAPPPPSSLKSRQLLCIAVGRPGEKHLSRVWKIRHQAYPKRRSPVGGYVAPDGTTQWSYPAAVEWQGNLYVTYSVAKEDCELAIIPLRVLAVE